MYVCAHQVLVRHFAGQETISDTTLWLMVFLLLLLPIIGTIAMSYASIILLHIGQQVRTSLIIAIYRKALRLSPAAKQHASTGQIVNMFSGDTKQIQGMLNFVVFIALAPVQIGVALAFIYQQVYLIYNHTDIN
jgi:ATP-binding cassette subfamily C (CFTR/MRP) protein 1